MSEQRAGDRTRTFITARLVFGSGAIAAECGVRNLSPTGAKLLVDAEIPLPSEFTLEIPSKNRSHKAKVAWRHGDEVGVAFEIAPAPANPDDPQARIAELEAENAKLRKKVRNLQNELALRGTIEMSGI